MFLNVRVGTELLFCPQFYTQLQRTDGDVCPYAMSPTNYNLLYWNFHKITEIAIEYVRK